jgi:hypothetical protein
MSEIKEFPRYTIAENTEVYDTLNKRVIKQWVDNDGYKFVRLVNENGNQKYRLIHRLMFEAFILKEGETMPTDVDHIDNNRANNKIANLRAAKRQENITITKRETYQVQMKITEDITYYSKIFKTLQAAVDDAIRAREEYHV